MQNTLYLCKRLAKRHHYKLAVWFMVNDRWSYALHIISNAYHDHLINWSSLLSIHIGQKLYTWDAKQLARTKRIFGNVKQAILGG